MTTPDSIVAPIPRLSLRAPEAAEALGISQRTLAEWMKAGDIPHIRRGGVILYPLRELADWLTKQTTVTSTQ